MSSSNDDWMHDCFGREEARRAPAAVDAIDNQFRRRFDLDSHGDSASVGSDDGVVIAAPDGAEMIANQWVYESFDKESWDDIVEEDTDDPDYCFLCSVAQTDKEQEGNPTLNNFIAFFANNYSRMTRKTLGRQGQVIYNRMLRPYTTFKKPNRCKIFIEHIERHAPTARIQMEQQVRVLQGAGMTLADKLLQRDQGSKKGEVRIDKTNLGTYMRVTTQSNALMEKLSKMDSHGKR